MSNQALGEDFVDLTAFGEASNQDFFKKNNTSSESSIFTESNQISNKKFNDFTNLGQKDQNNFYRQKRKGNSFVRRFNLKHVFRGGAIIWLKSEGKDYYVVFKSLSRPNRGIQLPGGRIERFENPAEAIIREVKEETGIETKIVCPLGFIYFENTKDYYSNLQIYYIVRPIFSLNVKEKWYYTDKDRTRQELECWFESVDQDNVFLSAGQDKVVDMFRQWLKEHKPENKEKIESIRSTFHSSRRRNSS